MGDSGRCVLLGRIAQVPVTRRNWPFLHEVAEKSSVQLPGVSCDSIAVDIRDMRPHREVVPVGEGTRVPTCNRVRADERRGTFHASHDQVYG